ncbi:uracil-DNA glycosylase [Sulfuricella sp.]|uniref:uracil-DNA glycosylase n=1 Tax=Sulfuricella sp. TaxID=2099377 RepID=UPI002C501BC0|nr:uracil-DNA glycosylase [Sulfuricella sp.]HUX65009.1 uracil-DNA glycosylase [Sulfuricella sp.]
MDAINNSCFSTDCRQCSRLAEFLDQVRCSNPDYFARPVPPFGADEPRLLIVGLAPGMHGANRTGRPFTGDFAGILLYRTLHKYGFASAPESVSATDGLQLIDCRITNAVKCLPPQNKPEPAEIRQCNAYLANEIASLDNQTAILALGTIAHQSVLRALGLKLKDSPFGHGAVHALPGGMSLYDSYHCSRYNTQTKRLTVEMFEAVFAEIRNNLPGR